MIRAFHSGAQAMKAQQTAVDVIANNMANANTTGYKEQGARFSDLLHSSIQGTDNTGASGEILVGNGVAVAAVQTDMAQGSPSATGLPFDYCIEGTGFFAVKDASGDTFYTRDGSFKRIQSGDGFTLADAGGREVLGSDENPVQFDAEGRALQGPGVFVFSNYGGLQHAGGGLYSETTLSGAASASEAKPAAGYLEVSNVDLARQMVGLVRSQRAFTLGSKAVQTADTIAEMANQLR